MKVKVIKAFTDKYTKEKYKVGQILTVNQGRFDEMVSNKFGVLVEEIKEVKKPNKKK